MAVLVNVTVPFGLSELLRRYGVEPEMDAALEKVVGPPPSREPVTASQANDARLVWVVDAVMIRLGLF